MTSQRPYTAIINANNGMIINSEGSAAQGVALTVSGGVKLAHAGIDDSSTLIYTGNCVYLKDLPAGGVSLACARSNGLLGTTQMPACGRNATGYTSNDKAWKGTADTDFCSHGTLVFEGNRNFFSASSP